MDQEQKQFHVTGTFDIMEVSREVLREKLEKEKKEISEQFPLAWYLLSSAEIDENIS